MNADAPVYIPQTTKSKPLAAATASPQPIHPSSKDDRQNGSAALLAIAPPGATQPPAGQRKSNQRSKEPKEQQAARLTTGQRTSTRISDGASDTPSIRAAELSMESPDTQPGNRPKPRQGAKRTPQSLNHLLNFSLPPRQPPISNQELQARRRRKQRTTTSSSYAPYRKERFLNANYRFLVDPTGDYNVQFCDPDVAVPWDRIRQVLLADTAKSHQCPICLSPPVAARVTKCGHVYCLPCITRYLNSITASTTEAIQQETKRAWKKCPICWDPIYPHDLKSVRLWTVWNLASLATAGETAANKASGLNTVTLRLVQREPRAVVAMPANNRLYFSSAFQALLTYPQVPWDFVPDALAFAKLILASPTYLAQETQADLVQMRESLIENRSLGDGAACQSLEQCIDQLSATAAADQSGPRKIPTLGRETQAREFVSNSGAMVAPTLTESDRVTGDFFHYYQSDDGQHIYLHPLDWRVVRQAYAGASDSGPPTSHGVFPAELTVHVEATEDTTMTEDLRNRCKYLDHLPLGCDLTFIQVDLQPLVPSDCYEQYRATLEQRRQKRQEKTRREQNEKQAAERRDARRIYGKSRTNGGEVGGGASGLTSVTSFADPDAFPVFTLSTRPPDSVGGRVGSEGKMDVTTTEGDSSPQLSFAAAVTTPDSPWRSANDTYQFVEDDFPSMLGGGGARGTAITAGASKSSMQRLVNKRIMRHSPPPSLTDNDTNGNPPAETSHSTGVVDAPVVDPFYDVEIASHYHADFPSTNSLPSRNGATALDHDHDYYHQYGDSDDEGDHGTMDAAEYQRQFLEAEPSIDDDFDDYDLHEFDFPVNKLSKASSRAARFSSKSSPAVSRSQSQTSLLTHYSAKEGPNNSGSSGLTPVRHSRSTINESPARSAAQRLDFDLTNAIQAQSITPTNNGAPPSSLPPKRKGKKKGKKDKHILFSTAQGGRQV